MKTTTANLYDVNEHGYYGQFGGAYVPEMLYPNVEELQRTYLSIMNRAGFSTGI